MVSAHMVRSECTWKPGTEPSVERKDFTLKCHVPLFTPWYELFNESRRDGKRMKYLVV